MYINILQPSDHMIHDCKYVRCVCKNDDNTYEVSFNRLNMWYCYRIPGIFRGMCISRLSMKPGFSWLKFRRWRLSKIFRVFHALLQGYVQKIYATNLSEIDKTLYQIAYHSRGNPRPLCGKSWESVLLPVGQSKWTDNITMNY